MRPVLTVLCAAALLFASALVMQAALIHLGFLQTRDEQITTFLTILQAVAAVILAALTALYVRSTFVLVQTPYRAHVRAVGLDMDPRGSWVVRVHNDGPGMASSIQVRCIVDGGNLLGSAFEPATAESGLGPSVLGSHEACDFYFGVPIVFCGGNAVIRASWSTLTGLQQESWWLIARHRMHLSLSPKPEALKGVQRLFRSKIRTRNLSAVALLIGDGSPGLELGLNQPWPSGSCLQWFAWEQADRMLLFYARNAMENHATILGSSAEVDEYPPLPCVGNPIVLPPGRACLVAWAPVGRRTLFRIDYEMAPQRQRLALGGRTTFLVRLVPRLKVNPQLGASEQAT